LHSQAPATIEQTADLGRKWFASFKTIAFISFVTCVVAAEVVVIIAAITGASDGPLQLLLSLVYAPFLLLLFGWFFYPLALFLVAVMWSLYTQHMAATRKRRLLFVCLSTFAGCVPFLFFDIVDHLVDPLIGALSGAVGGALIVRFKK
jgi:hypothetical protein